MVCRSGFLGDEQIASLKSASNHMEIIQVMTGFGVAGSPILKTEDAKFFVSFCSYT